MWLPANLLTIVTRICFVNYAHCPYYYAKLYFGSGYHFCICVNMYTQLWIVFGYIRAFTDKPPAMILTQIYQMMQFCTGMCLLWGYNTKTKDANFVNVDFFVFPKNLNFLHWRPTVILLSSKWKDVASINW